eukprot:COSAG04_NODE_22363_length_356_cov_0.793774_1_plen_82_part_10
MNGAKTFSDDDSDALFPIMSALVKANQSLKCHEQLEDVQWNIADYLSVASLRNAVEQIVVSERQDGRDQEADQLQESIGRIF